MTDTRKKHVLLVDDDEEDFFLLRDIFKECHPDVELTWLKDGEEALSYLRKDFSQNGSKPAIVLLDLNMPKLNGREVLAQMRGSKDFQYVPVVVLSNSMNKKEALDTYVLGVNSFIRKPAGYKELREFTDTFYKYWFTYSTLC